jgi:hypothetical protein
MGAYRRAHCVQLGFGKVGLCQNNVDLRRANVGMFLFRIREGRNVSHVVEIGGGENHILVQGDMVGCRQVLCQDIVASGMRIDEVFLQIFCGKFGDLAAPGFGGGRCRCGDDQSQYQQR